MSKPTLHTIIARRKRDEEREWTAARRRQRWVRATWFNGEWLPGESYASREEAQFALAFAKQRQRAGVDEMAVNFSTGEYFRIECAL